MAWTHSKNTIRHHSSPTLNKTSLFHAVACALLIGSSGQVIAQDSIEGEIGNPESWRTEEFLADWGLGAIGAEYAYARGLTGASIDLGVLDTGISANHVEFAGSGRLKPLQFGIDFGEGFVLDVDGGAGRLMSGDHGTHVGGTVGASRDGSGMHGVAFGANLVSGSVVGMGDTDLLMSYIMQGVNDWVAQNGLPLLTAEELRALLPQRWGVDFWSDVLAANFDTLSQSGARVINNSWGISMAPGSTFEDVSELYEQIQDDPTFEAAMRAVRDHDTLFVFAAGNGSVGSSLAHTDPYGALPAFLPELEDNWVTVVSLDETLERSGFSSVCGEAKNWCLAAPGGGVTSSTFDPFTDSSFRLNDVAVALSFANAQGIPGDTPQERLENFRQVIADDPEWQAYFLYSGIDITQPDAFGTALQALPDPVDDSFYADFSGTSMAAPHVTGALGLLMERFPYLDNSQVRDVMLTTATDLGETGVDEIYGWGLLNLRKAIEGYGQFRVDTEVVMDRPAGGAKVWDGPAWDDWTNDIGGPGRLTKSGVGWLRLSGDNSFAGVTVKQGTLELTGANAFTGDVKVDGATFLLAGSMTGSDITSDLSSVVVSGQMIGGDIEALDTSLSISGTVNGNIEAWFGTTDVSGTVSGDINSVEGPLNLSGTLNGNLYEYGNGANVSGSVNGGDITIEDGALILSGTLDTGDLSVENFETRGLLNLSGAVINGDVSTRNANLEMSGAIENGSLAFDTGIASISGAIAGGGIDFRNGTLDLSGRVAGGGLNLVNSVATVNGSIEGATMVSADSTLTGTGSSGDLTVHGTIAPGNSIGTFTVNGNYVQAGGSFYEAELAHPSSSDLLSITGTATLQGGTVKVFRSPGDYVLGQTYDILSAAGGVTGTFAGVDSSAFDTPFLDFELFYSANEVDLSITRGAPFASVASTHNQLVTATAIDSMSDTNALVQSLVLTNEAQALAAFDQLSGELYPSVRSALIDSSRMPRDAAMNRARAASDAFSRQAHDGQPNGAWVEAYASGGNLNSDGNAARINQDSHAILAGYDYQFDAGWRLGALIGSGRTDLSVRDRSSEGHADTRHFGVYGGGAWGGFGVRAGWIYAIHDVDTVRRIAFPGFNDQAHADFDGRTRQAVVEAGYRFDRGSWEAEPFLQYAHVRMSHDRINEQGGAAALTGGSSDSAVGIGTAGARFSANLGESRQDQTWLSLRGMLGYRRANGDRTPETTLAFAEGPEFGVRGASLTDGAMVAELGFAARTSDRTLLEVDYSGQFADEGKDHGANVRFSWQF